MHPDFHDAKLQDLPCSRILYKCYFLWPTFADCNLESRFTRVVLIHVAASFYYGSFRYDFNTPELVIFTLCKMLFGGCQILRYKLNIRCSIVILYASCFPGP